jgi:hypothetical protein
MADGRWRTTNQAAGRLGGRSVDCRKAARRVNRDLGKVEKDCRQAAPKEEQGWENLRIRREGSSESTFTK